MSAMRILRVLLGVSLAAAIPSGRAGAAPKDTQEAFDWPEVISRLKQEAYEHPGQSQVRQQLAVAYNNYAVSLTHQGQWDMAVRQFQEALRIDAGNAQLQKNFSQVYLHQAQEAYDQHDPAGAVEALEQSIALNPELVETYILLGIVEYDRQKLKEAKAAWQRALELDPSQTDVAKRLKQVTEELPVESKFERLSQAYFDLRYEEQLERPAGFDIRDALLEARRTVGSDFAYWPKHKIVVLIYSAESFRKLREESPEWVAGQFDGKIRVPLPNAQFNQGLVRNIMFHEYTHALIYDLTGGQCPTWMNEGLAEYEGRSQFSQPLRLLAGAFQTNALVPFTELSNHITHELPAEQVGLAYEQSYSIVAYLIERYGFWRIRQVLKALGGGQAWEAALASEFRMKLPRLEADWQEQLAPFLAAHQ